MKHAKDFAGNDVGRVNFRPFADAVAVTFEVMCKQAVRQMMTPVGWQPIATAPKHCHILLGYPCDDDVAPDGYVSQGFWTEGYADGPDDMGHDGGFVDCKFEFFRCPRSFGIESYRTKGLQPTHWMPLPAAPTAPKGGEQT